MPQTARLAAAGGAPAGSGQTALGSSPSRRRRGLGQRDGGLRVKASKDSVFPQHAFLSTITFHLKQLFFLAIDGPPPLFRPTPCNLMPVFCRIVCSPCTLLSNVLCQVGSGWPHRPHGKKLKRTPQSKNTARKQKPARGERTGVGMSASNGQAKSQPSRFFSGGAPAKKMSPQN